MFYLLKPDGSMGWLDVLQKSLVDEQEIDLDLIQWDRADRRVDRETLDLALRFGYEVSTGIAVDVSDLVPLDHLREVEAIDPDRARVSDLPSSDLMEALAPGSKEYDRQLDERVKESHNRAVERARVDYAEHRDANPVRDPLVAHWSRLGGRLK